MSSSEDEINKITSKEIIYLKTDNLTAKKEIAKLCSSSRG